MAYFIIIKVYLSIIMLSFFFVEDLSKHKYVY